MAVLKRHRNLFKALKRIKNRSDLITIAYYCMNDPNILVAGVCEFLDNVNSGNIRLNNSRLNKLRKYKRSVQFLINPQNSMKRKREFLNKTGKGIPLLATLLPLAADLVLGNLFRK